jgi:hypothetical protein
MPPSQGVQLSGDSPDPPSRLLPAAAETWRRVDNGAGDDHHHPNRRRGAGQ